MGGETGWQRYGVVVTPGPAVCKHRRLGGSCGLLGMHQRVHDHGDRSARARKRPSTYSPAGPCGWPTVGLAGDLADLLPLDLTTIQRGRCGLRFIWTDSPLEESKPTRHSATSPLSSQAVSASCGLGTRARSLSVLRMITSTVFVCIRLAFLRTRSLKRYCVIGRGLLNEQRG